MDEKTFSNMVKESIENEEKLNKIKNKEDMSFKEKIENFDFNDVRKKVKRNFFVGFGLGLILAACGMWLFKPATLEQLEIKKQKEVEKMRNTEIIQAAKAIGMVFPEEIDNSFNDDDSNKKSNKEEIDG